MTRWEEEKRAALAGAGRPGPRPPEPGSSCVRRFLKGSSGDLRALLKWTGPGQDAGGSLGLSLVNSIFSLPPGLAPHPTRADSGIRFEPNSSFRQLLGPSALPNLGAMISVPPPRTGRPGAPALDPQGPWRAGQRHPITGDHSRSCVSLFPVLADLGVSWRWFRGPLPSLSPPPSSSPLSLPPPLLSLPLPPSSSHPRTGAQTAALVLSQLPAS